MKHFVWDSIKVFLIFTICTCLFYFGLRFMQAEYDNFHRYDPPDGPAVKVFKTEADFFERFRLFFQLGD